MVAEAHRLRYEDYLQTPEDGNKYEIIEGELLVHDPTHRTPQTPAKLDPWFEGRPREAGMRRGD